MRKIQWLITASLILSLTACERQSAEDEKPTETTSENQTAEAAAPTNPETTVEKKLEEEREEAKAKPPALKNLDVNPYSEEFTSFEISWKGEGAAVDLLEKPEAGAAKVGTIKLDKGGVVAWKSYIYHVLEPVAYVATKPIEYKGYSVVEPDSLKLGDPEDHSFGKDDTLYKYAYAGEGTCYTGWQGDDFVFALGNCPDDSQGWKLEGAEKPGSEWFVEVEGADKKTGWLLVDERFETRAVSTLEGE